MAKAGVNFETAMAELEQILDQIADEQTPLDEAVSLYAKAAKLLESCHKKLTSAKLRVEEIELNTGEGANGL